MNTGSLYRSSLVLTLLLIVAGCSSRSEGSDNPGNLSAIPFLSIYADPTGEVNTEEASRAEFRSIRGAILDEGFSKSAFWLKLEVPELPPDEKRFVVFESVTLDQVELYPLRGYGRPPVQKAGDLFPRSVWPVPWSDYVTFPVTAGESYLIRLQTTSLILFPVTIRTETNLRNFTEKRTYISALYAGFILMLSIAALLLFLALRDLVYVFYAGYITMQTLAFAALYSSFHRLLWPESSYIQNHLYFFAQAISLAFGTAFFRVFLDLPTKRPRLNILVLGVMVFALIIAIGSLFSTQNVILSRSLSILYFLWIPVFLIMTMRQIEPGRIDVWIFASVWGAVYVAGILYMLIAARIIPYNTSLFLGPALLLPFDAVFFVLSLYQRYQSLISSRAKLEEEMKSTLAKLAMVSKKPHSNREKVKYPKTKLSGLNIKKKLELLDKILRTEKAFKNELLTLADLAEKLGMTTHQLSEMCNAQLGTSFPRLLSYHRVNEASELLQRGDLNILQIAFEAGFASKSAFNIEFKRVTGMTPSEFRAQPGRVHSWESSEMGTGA